MGVEEVSFRRTSVHVHHDAKRLDHGEDLNDALLDFFVKLGQALIPCGGLEGGFHSVAYLGSLFYNVLTSRGVVDGRQGHANVANWAKRRLGQGGLFFDGIGALAVPVNEMLGDGKGGKEKHWWLALLLNPRAGGRKGCNNADNAENMSLVCLDSYAGADLKCNPPVRVMRTQCMGSYPLEVHGLARKGVFASVRFKARGDGTAGPLAEPRKSILRVHGREYMHPRAEYTIDNRGDEGRPGQCEGTIEFALDSTEKIAAEYEVDFGGRGEFGKVASLQLRRVASQHQEHVASFLAGYVSKEWENTDEVQRQYDSSQVESSVCLPDVPQQETDHDCGFFILEQILLSLQLPSELFRMLAKTSSAMLSAMPWPSQKDVLRRKSLLREALNAIFKAAEEHSNTDVEVLLKEDPELRALVKSALWDGPRFCDAARVLVSHSAPRQKFSIADLGTMSTKELRSLCTQHGVLPPGTVERADLLRALVPVVVKLSPPKAEESKQSPEQAPEIQASPVASPTEEDTPKAESSGPQPTHLSTLRFTVEDLDKLPLKTLRGLCIQHGVMPSCAMERDDFRKALIPVASRMEGGDSTTPAKESTSVLESEPQPFPQGQKRPPEHLSSLRFTVADLVGMPLKTLRGLCVQHRVLPSCAVERDDFVKALTPVASDSQPDGSVEASPKVEVCIADMDPGERKAKWQRVAASGDHLGGIQFSEADLAAMPLKTLKGLCTQYKVVPACAVERADFVKALIPFAC